MSFEDERSRDEDRLPLFGRAFGLRIAMWYATLFILGALAVMFLTYSLTRASLEQRDRQIITQKAGDYAAAYRRGGLNQLASTVRAEQLTAPERLFVRVVDRGREAVVLSDPEGWDPDQLQTASLRLADGTLVQVGKSTEAREDLLARFRAVLGIVTLSIVIVALTGGYLVTRSAVVPIRELTRTVRRIIRTGRTDARVPLTGRAGQDAIEELTVLFNAMLDKIEGLVTAMRGSLDNVSHDLRTPLTRLRGQAEMALAGAPDLDRYREALADCVEEADRVLVMLNALMDISEAESGTMQLQREPVRLADVVERAVELYREVADVKGVVLHVRARPDTTEVLAFGDRTRLEQAAANLIDNAVKFTPSGGRVEVTTGLEDGKAILTVVDTGPGIPQDELPRIWERLFRGDASRTERGLGLGLSLVRAIVHAHGGTVEVESEPGRGATFTMRLPTA
ncbi:MAG TPA: ATP-binding protein [Vicinamibacterales bacterium]|jgi:signal transduction histidine kinase|nr:ATP-binding protein [Vicinamibacterales bacterium]